MRVGLFAIISTAAWAGAPYLAEVGPVMIRFQQLPPRLNPTDVLPPLKMADDPSVDTPETNRIEQVQAAILPAPAVEAQTPTVSSVDPTPAPQPTPQSAEPTVTPQMLLRFFNPGSNREALIQAPLEFTPPQPGKSSSATYISP